jgi:hypothetical protein
LKCVTETTSGLLVGRISSRCCFNYRKYKQALK